MRIMWRWALYCYHNWIDCESCQLTALIGANRLMGRQLFREYVQLIGTVNFRYELPDNKAHLAI
jgi:hypothetical protein